LTKAQEIAVKSVAQRAIWLLAADEMQLNDLLAKKSIDVSKVLLLRHRPFEPKLKRVLP
jgi:hypothetical protein